LGETIANDGCIERTSLTINVIGIATKFVGLVLELIGD